MPLRETTDTQKPQIYRISLQYQQILFLLKQHEWLLSDQHAGITGGEILRNKQYLLPTDIFPLCQV